MEVFGQIQMKSLKTLELSKSQAGVYQRTWFHEQFHRNNFEKTDKNWFSNTSYVVEVYFIPYSIIPLP